MADLKVTRQTDAAQQVHGVAAESDHQSGHQQGDRSRDGETGRRASRPGSEELALALTEDGRAVMEARYEQDADGNPMIRIVDIERDETVALVTPEELRDMAEQTGLPPGLLVRAQT